MDAIRFEATVEQGGVVHIPEVREGDRVEVIVLKLASAAPTRRQTGWMRGKMTIHPDFDSPIPGIEDYI